MGTVTKMSKSNPSSTRKRKTKTLPASETPVLTHEQIAERAYQLWMERGQHHGQDLEDWLNAESLLREESDRF
jgi:hypothetical protein